MAANKAGDNKVAVIIGANSKWQADGVNTRFRHGGTIPDAGLPVESRWGIGGALALKFADEGFLTVLTTRRADNAAGLAAAIAERGGRSLTVEMDVTGPDSIASAFDEIGAKAGLPEVVIYNAGYMDGRDMPDGQDLMEFIPEAMFDKAMAIACRGPFLVAKAVLPGMRAAGRGSFFLTNNSKGLRGQKRHNGESFYLPRVMMRAFAQALTEEYSPHNIHVANVVIDGMIDSPGTRALNGAERLIDPARIAEAYFYLHSQDPSCWSHEIQLTPQDRAPSV